MIGYNLQSYFSTGLPTGQANAEISGDRLLLQDSQTKINQLVETSLVVQEPTWRGASGRNSICSSRIRFGSRNLSLDLVAQICNCVPWCRDSAGEGIRCVCCRSCPAQGTTSKVCRSRLSIPRAFSPCLALRRPVADHLP